jgi:hypothetical protein
MVNKGKPHHSFVYTLYNVLHVSAFVGHSQMYKITEYLEERIIATVIFRGYHKI